MIKAPIAVYVKKYIQRSYNIYFLDFFGRNISQATIFEKYPYSS